ncbi:hypothetical protein [Agromyces bauzanensis]
MRDQMTRSIMLQAAAAVGVGIGLFWLASLLPTVCPAMVGGPSCGPALRQHAAASSTLLVVAVGIAAVAAAMSAPRHRRLFVFGWGVLVLALVILGGIGWIIVSGGFIVV